MLPGQTPKLGIFKWNDQQSKQSNKEALVGQMIRCRNQIMSRAAVQLDNTRTIMNSALGTVGNTFIGNQEQLITRIDEKSSFELVCNSNKKVYGSSSDDLSLTTQTILLLHF